MKKKLSILLLALCLLSIGFGGVVQAQNTEVTLTAWTHDQLYLDFFNSRLADWEALHPDITFTYDFQVVSNAPDAFLQALTAGEPLPDLLGIEQDTFPNFMKNGTIASNFVDLTDVIADTRDQYSEGRLAIYSYEGRVYAFESQLAASVYYYQPAIFEANGLEVPTTWEEALEVGAALAEAGSAFSVATNNGSFWQTMFNQRGGAIFDVDGNFVFGDEENRALAVEVATLIQQGVANGTFMVVLGGDMWSGVTIPTAYRDGALAGQVMADWWGPAFLEPGVSDMSGQWAVAKPPVWEGGGYGTLTWGGTGWGVNSQSPDAAIATEFLTFMYLGEESQIQKFELISNFPWMITAYDDERVTGLESEFYGGQRLGEIYMELSSEMPVWYQSPFRSNFQQAAGDNLPLLFDGTLTPEAYVDELIRLTQEAIDFGF